MNNFIGKAIVHIVPAGILGVLIDKIMHKADKNYNLSPLASVTIQTTITVTVLYIIEKYMFPKYAKEWQDNTPGIYFTFFIFAVQIHLLDNIRELVEGRQAFEDEND